jgi:hypothetical protein
MGRSAGKLCVETLVLHHGIHARGGEVIRRLTITNFFVPSKSSSSPFSYSSNSCIGVSPLFDMIRGASLVDNFHDIAERILVQKIKILPKNR